MRQNRKALSDATASKARWSRGEKIRSESFLRDALLQGDKVLLHFERGGNGNGRVCRVNLSADDGQAGVWSGAGGRLLIPDFLAHRFFKRAPLLQ